MGTTRTAYSRGAGKGRRLHGLAILLAHLLLGCKPEIIGSGEMDPTLGCPSSENGSLDLQSAFGGPGLYKCVANRPAASSICTGSDFAGISGAAICQSGTSLSPAGASSILMGYDAWNQAGQKLAGSLVNRGALDSRSGFPGAGFYDGTMSIAPSASQITRGNAILGITGSFIGTYAATAASNALRDPGATGDPVWPASSTSGQLTTEDEKTAYAGASLPSSGTYKYRDVPDDTRDDEGYIGTNCSYATRPAADCGTTQASVAARIADCASKNPSTSTWNGALRCNRGQSTWKLVTRSGNLKEVWQDQRTQLLWSTRVGSAVNWCQASGSTKPVFLKLSGTYNGSLGTPIVGNGIIGGLTGGSSAVSESLEIRFTSATSFTVTDLYSGTGHCNSGSITAGGLTTAPGSSATWSKAGYCSFTITQGSVNFAANDVFWLMSADAGEYCQSGLALQPASPVSYCAEGAGLNAPSGENWAGGTYMAAKGLMGKNSTPSVRWRLPTVEDYQQANIDGIRMVMPDAGISGDWRPIIDDSTGGAPEYAATSSSNNFPNVWAYHSHWGGFGGFTKSATLGVRCVGR